jgi:pyruvate dehydrogenase E2 component (dihydrolipoamide acetyltransferase)
MAKAVMMPQVGQDIETATIVEWHKKENDTVNKGDVIATVESDKASFDVEAYESGVLLKRLYEEGQEVKVLTPIAYLGRQGESVEEVPATVQVNHPQAALEAATQPDSSVSADKCQGQLKAKASPSARRLAKEKGIDLKNVTGTGPGGRITSQDLLNACEDGKDTDADEVIPFSPMRARIAERLTRSKQTIPHFYLFTEVDMAEVLARRRQLNEDQDVKITVTDMIIKAVALALREYPKMNAHVVDNKVVVKKNVNIGVAVSVPDGLAVPVIPDADTKTLIQISQESRQNTEAMRAGKLLSTAVSSFTVSNLGMYKVDMFLPIINPPECAILAIGQIAEKPAVVQGNLAARSLMNITLACDHRAVDGTIAARFLEKIKQQLENDVIRE